MKNTTGKSGIIFTIATFLVISDINAQSTFVRMYNQGNMGYSAREVNGNSYVVAGSTDFYFNWHFLTMSSLATTGIHLFKTDVPLMEDLF